MRTMATLLRSAADTGVRAAGRRLRWPLQLRDRSAWASPAAARPLHRPVEPREARASADRDRLQSWLFQDADAVSDLAYCLSFANDAGDFDQNFARLMNDRMRRQLVHSSYQLRAPPAADDEARRLDTRPLPRSLADALRPTSRAIVITETAAPFRVCDVNRAWEDLCGYSFLESKDRTLGSLLRGRETDQLAATALVARLLAGEEEAGATLTNYTKSGRRFRNRLRAGPLRDERHRVTHFVGVLQEIDDGF